MFTLACGRRTAINSPEGSANDRGGRIVVIESRACPKRVCGAGGDGHERRLSRIIKGLGLFMAGTRFARVDRRAFLSGVAVCAFAGATFASFAARAQEAGDDQAEWRQSYESPDKLGREGTPTMSPATVAATEQAINLYQSIVSRGGWNAVPAVELKIGSKSKAVLALRQRLVASGDLGQEAGVGPVFDSYVDAAVKRFQIRQGLSPTGEVNDATLAELNVPAEARLQQLQTNLVRLRAYSGELGRRFVMVNIPAAAVETVEDGVVHSHHAAGVGKIDRQSPIMQTKATEVNFNPFWTVPPSLIKKDLIPKMQADPSYLTDEKIRVFNKIRAPTSIRSASCASTSPTLTASTCTTRPPRACSATISASSRRAACACRTCATMSPGCSRTTPAGAAIRSTR
jgi:hypothetical protein